MPSYTFEVDGKTYDVDSQRSLSTDQLRGYAKKFREGFVSKEPTETAAATPMGDITGFTEPVAPGKPSDLSFQKGLAKSAVMAPVGMFGDVESMLRPGVSTLAKIQAPIRRAMGLSPVEVSKETVLPTTEEATRAVFGAPATPAEAGGRAVGPMLVPGLPQVGVLKGLGAAGRTVGKAGEFVKGAKAPEAIAAVEDLAEVGRKGFDVLQKRAAQLYEARSAEANNLYNRAFEVAREAQAKGEPFAISEPGQRLLAELENEKSVLAGGEKFERGQERIAGIDRLINAIKGTTTGGEKVPIGAGKISSKLTKTTPTKTTQKDIEALVEELRFLRDVDAKGKPYEAYASLSADYKRNLIDKLERALYDWNPSYQRADEAYKAASRKLDPFRTELMSRALKGEKFNAKDLVASPEEFGKLFFTDVNGVQNLKLVTQDPAVVAQLGKEYVAATFANKTPAQIKTWAFNPNNVGWMKEAGILEPVQEYATKAVTAESRKRILEKIGYGAVGGAIISAVGSPFYYGVRRALGL